jgi:hypothetical protein
MCLVCSVHSTRSSGSHCTGTALQQPYDHTLYSQQCFLARQTEKRAVRSAACAMDLVRENLAGVAETYIYTKEVTLGHKEKTSSNSFVF